MIVRTSRKTTSKENRDQVADQSLQGKEGYKCQDHNSVAETAKEATPYKGKDNRPWYQS